jgi:replicative DNA helicase
MRAGETRIDGQLVEPAVKPVPGYRVPPQAVEVEKHVLGAVFLDPVAAGPALELLTPEDFYLERHAIIWEALLAMAAASTPIDLTTLTDQLRKTNRFEHAGGDAYLLEISTEVVSAANAGQHAAIIREKSLLRRLALGCNRLVDLAHRTDASAKVAIGEAEKLLLELAEERTTQGLTPWDRITPETLKDLQRAAEGKLTGVPTGLADLNRITCGLQPTDFIILAGRPAMGKTGLGLTISWKSALNHGTKVAFFSMEMGKKQLQQRVFCAHQNLDLHKLRGQQTPEQLEAFAKSVLAMQGLPLYIDDGNGKTPLQILSQCRRMRLEKGVDLIVVDFCQLGRLDYKTDNRAEEVGDFAYALKGIAKELDIPVIGLAQLNRECEKRSGDENGDISYKLSDLNESGKLEQAADIIGVIHRPEVLSKKAPKGKAQLQVIKYRNGPTGDIDLRFNHESASFSDWVPPTWAEQEELTPIRPGRQHAYRGAWDPANRYGGDF